MFIKVAKWGLLAPSDIPKSYQIAGLMSLNLMSSYVGHDSLKKNFFAKQFDTYKNLENVQQTHEKPN